jgi:hypothetical protein
MPTFRLHRQYEDPVGKRRFRRPASSSEIIPKEKLELDGVYDSYTQVPATATTAQTAEIVIRDGTIVPKKKAAPHKPTAGHRAPAR